MTELKFETQKRKINDLIPYEHNPRQMTNKQIRDLTASLEKFNLAEIPVINTDNTIIAGHQRLNILQLLGRGEEEIDVRVPNRELDDKEVQEYNIRSNKNTGGWDWDILNNSFDSSDLEKWGFSSQELVGFDDGKDVDFGKMYEIAVECENEEEQEKIYNKLMSEGYKCRLLTL